MMRLLFVVDGRSPIALNWIGYFLDTGHEVHLVSTFMCEADPRLASFTFIPTALSGLKAASATPHRPAAGAIHGLDVWGARTVGLRTAVRRWVGPLTLPGSARRLNQVITSVQPELVHAMRIPYEGMLAALANPPMPFVVSVWGNDFTLHAPSTPTMRRLTRRTLGIADAVHADCRRDVRLAEKWGFPSGRTRFVLPGSGGIQLSTFYPPPEIVSEPVIVQPRGVRAYVRNELFFRALPLVLKDCPEARVICPNMAGEAWAVEQVRTLGIADQVALLPSQTRSQMADIFRRSRMVVSPTTHDGTPNTLLEAMACGCLPVAGDLESLREWITPGVNGLLVELSTPDMLADAIMQGLKQTDLCLRARQVNLELIRTRADYDLVMPNAARIYRDLIG